MNSKVASSPTGRAVPTIVAILLLSVPNLMAKEDLADRTKTIAGDAKNLAVDVGQSVAAGAQDAWEHIDEAGLAGGTGDDIVAWMIVGALVGAIAGMLTSMRSTGLGWVGRLLLGLMGALLGGLAVRLSQLDLGWGPVVLRYEELLFSFAGAVLLIILVRLTRAGTKKKEA